MRHKINKQVYAVKQIPLVKTAHRLQRVLQECALLGRLAHRNIIRFVNAWIEEAVTPTAPEFSEHGFAGGKGLTGLTALFIQTEYYDGRTLRDVIDT